VGNLQNKEDALRALVTGGNGFIGSHLVDALLSKDWEVVVFDRENSPFYALPDRVTFIKEELSNRGALRNAIKNIDVVFHLAWSGVHQSSNQDLRGHVEINLLPTLSFFELSLDAGVKRIVFISSGGTVYGRANNLPIKEDDPKNPICAYGVTKLAAENYLQLYGYLHGLDYIILRPSVAYGERQNPNGIQGAVAVFMGKVLRREPIIIWGDGTTVRDFFYVGDLVEACLLAATTQARCEIFNMGGGQSVTLNQLVEMIQKVTGINVALRYEPKRAFDVPEIVLDISKATHCLGWRPHTGFADGLSRTWQWIKSAEKVD
jgi:UDP-glucose 4-epimerase